MKILRRFADRNDPRSLSAMFRRRRSRHFFSLLAELPRPLRILDVGGEEAFWDVIGGDGLEIVLANNEPQTPRNANIEFVLADACDLSQFADRSFDLVVSNSVIEHVDDPAAMAREIRRVGKRYYVQTPNRWFPLEPHFLVPFFQFLPLRTRARLLMHFDLGWLHRTRNRDEALKIVASVKLLDARDLRRLFPEGRVWRERVLGLTKSLIVFSTGVRSKVKVPDPC